jgi:hypothetical protein
MKRARVRTFPALFILAFLAAVAAGPARGGGVEGHFDRTLKVTGPVDLGVETGSGSISVRAGGSGSVEVRGTIRGNGWLSNSDIETHVHALESNPPIEQDGNRIRVGHIEDRDLTRNISISYELVVPAETRLRSETGSGSQTLEGIAGPAETSSGSGSLRISRIGAEVHARTGSGSIELDSVRGNVKASSGSGSIHATGIAGGLVASTGSGDVKLEQTAAGDVEVQTGSGTVELSGVKGSVRVSTGSGTIRAQGEPAGPWRLHTASGRVTVHLPEQAAFDLEAHTSSGRIESTLPITVQGSISPRELHGKVRGGGSLVELSTSSGSIHIE